MSFQDLEQGSSARPPPRSSQSSSQTIASSLFQITTAVNTFRRLVDSIGTSKDTSDHRRKLHSTRQRILQLITDTSAKLKSLSELDRDTNTSATKKVEDAKLAKNFQATLEEFQKVQKLSAERESTYAPSAPPSSQSTIPGEDLPTIREHEKQPFVQVQKRQELVLLDNEIAFNEAIIEEREQGIIEVQNQIGEVNVIFNDLALLIHEQGQYIDDIGSHIENASVGTTQARVQLAKASKSTKSRSKWCCWLVVIVVVVVVIVVIVLLI